MVPSTLVPLISQPTGLPPLMTGALVVTSPTTEVPEKPPPVAYSPLPHCRVLEPPASPNLNDADL